MKVEFLYNSKNYKKRAIKIIFFSLGLLAIFLFLSWKGPFVNASPGACEVHEDCWLPSRGIDVMYCDYSMYPGECRAVAWGPFYDPYYMDDVCVVYDENNNGYYLYIGENKSVCAGNIECTFQCVSPDVNCTSKCESACGADPLCDDKSPGDSCGSGGTCNDNCECVLPPTCSEACQNAGYYSGMCGTSCSMPFDVGSDCYYGCIVMSGTDCPNTCYCYYKDTTKPSCLSSGCTDVAGFWYFENTGAIYCEVDGCRYYNGHVECTDSVWWGSGWQCVWDGENCDDRDGCVDNDYHDYSCSGGSCVFSIVYDTCDCVTCGDCQYCSGGFCYNYCLGTDTDCGCTSCTNCNALDGCSVGYYLDYYCSGTSCTYTSSCTEACCDAYYGDTAAYCSGGVCYAPGCNNNGVCETPTETYLNCPNDCCASDCTATYDSTCHSACNGWNGCSLTSGCNGLSSGSNICDAAGCSRATCCEGSFIDCGSYTCSAGSCTTVCSQICGASCDADSDCSCPIDACVGTDWYDYPVYGDCTTACNCNTATGAGQPCQPTITLNHPSCVVECTAGGSCSTLGEVCCAGGILYQCQEVTAFGPSGEVYAYKESPNEEYENAPLGAASIVDIVKEFWQKILRFSF